MAIETNYQDLQNEINDAINKFNGTLPSAVEVVATSSIALLKNRYIQVGLKANETGELSSFPDYSEGYKKSKKFKRLKTDSTPNRLVLSGKMLQSLKITDNTIANNKYVVTVSAGNEKEDNKAKWNSERYGDIYYLSNEEKKELNEIFAEEMDNKLKNAFK